MSKEFGMLAHHWNGSFEQVKGWFCSRKYNGWSALWDGGVTRGMLATEVPWYYKGGDKRQIISTGLWSLGRGNKPKVIQAPSYFTGKLPKNVPVHGELWFSDRLDIIKRTCGLKFGYSPMWHNIRFKAFGIKSYALWEGLPDNIVLEDEHNPFTCKDMKFKASIEYLKNFENNIFEPVDVAIVKSQKCIDIFKEMSEQCQWEGLMFSNPNGIYECKRSWNNLKYKNVYETEAAICGYEEGKTGRVLGKVGAIQATLVWDSKVESVFGGTSLMTNKEANFCISGLTDPEREWDECRSKYPIGSKIKFRYTGVSSHGIPQSCNVYRGV